MLRRLAGPLLLVLAITLVGLGVLTLTGTSEIHFFSGGGALDPADYESTGVDCGSVLIPHSDDELCVDQRADTQRTGLLQLAMGAALGALSWIAFRRGRTEAPANGDEQEPGIRTTTAPSLGDS